MLQEFELRPSTQEAEKLAAHVSNTSSSRRVVDALLDLISLEGIYPCLLPGVGPPIKHRNKLLHRDGFEIKESPGTARHDRHDFLKRIIDALNSIALGGRVVRCLLLERTFVDAIAANAQLTFGPDASRDPEMPKTFNMLLKSTPPQYLFPSLMGNLHNACPDWFA